MIKLKFPNDYEGPVEATLFRKDGCKDSKKGVLYIPGFADYFFHNHVHEAFNRAGYRLYVLEPRKTGHSYLEHQHFCYCRSLREYFPEIDESIRIMKEDGMEKITILGHSTGGLTTLAYASEGKNRHLVTSLILNSPFLEFKIPGKARFKYFFIASVMSVFCPYSYYQLSFSPLYPRSLYCKLNGEWDYDISMKPVGGSRLYYPWVKTVHHYQKKILKGLNLSIPVLCMSSDKNFSSKEWDDRALISDTTLNVKDIEERYKLIGPKSEYVTIKDAMHDIFLSSEPVRNKGLKTAIEWLDRQ